MKWKCRRIQGILADEGPQALRSDAAAQAHLESCGECFEALENLSQLDAGLAGLSPHDAPDELVEKLLGRDELRESLPPPKEQRIPSWKRPPRWLGMAAAAVLVVFVAIWIIPQSRHRAGSPGAGVALSEPAEPVRTQEDELDELSEKLQALGYLGGGSAPASSADAPARSAPEGKAGRRDRDKREAGKKDGREQARQRSTNRRLEEVPEEEAQTQDQAATVIETSLSATAATSPASPAPLLPLPSIPRPPPPKPPRAPSEPIAEIEEKIEVVSEAWPVEARKVVSGRLRSRRDPWEVLENVPGDAMADRINVGGNESSGRFRKGDDYEGDDLDGGNYYHFEAETEIPKTQQAIDFLLERRRTEDLRFQPAEGYWANTYVPGDPALRLLDSRLRKLDPTPWQPFVDEPLRLHGASRQPTQPFDPPAQAALAAYLHADWRSVTGPTRLLVQVGLQGTPRYSGRRPAMNVGVVLDLRGTASAETLAAMRALLSALAQAKDVGDRFRLFVAGRPGAQLLGPSEFRHGPVTVTLQKLAEPASGAGPTLTLPEAMAAAIDAVAATDDPTQPLGSSLVMLATAQSLAPFADQLFAQAHASAVAGVPVSAVGIATVPPEELERLALAGQGHRRLLRTPAEADALVDRELSAVSRVIARAMRLRIRLAPGVKLVAVVGSRRLEEVLADRVREAERSIDRRLARNLGIEADRGEDEEGIQIVIPSFYAGDAHAVLLDVVVPGPGAVADLTVRYKDLVQMGNGVARAHLSLSRGEPVRGPLERNVLGNYLAHRLEKTLGRAGAWLDSDQRDEAIRELEGIRHLLAGLRLEVTGFDKDRDLARDLVMLDEYLTLLAAGVGVGVEDRRNLADSLRYAGRLKVLPRPPSGGAP